MKHRSMILASNPLVVFLLLRPLSFAGAEANVCGGMEHMSCPTTVTASTTLGVSLVQSVSKNRRVGASEVKENLNRLEQGHRDVHLDVDVDAATTAQVATEGQVNLSGFTELSNSGLSVASTEETSASSVESVVKNALQNFKESATNFASAALSLLQGAVESVDKATSGRRSHLTEQQKRSAGALVFMVLVLLMLGAIYIFMTRPDHDSHLNKQPQYPANRMGNSPPGMTRSPGPPGFSHTNTGLPPGSRSYAYAPQQYGQQPRSPMSTNQALSRQSRNSRGGHEEDEAMSTFCPDLVVPEQCECILVVPVYAPAGRFNISDMSGRAVLYGQTTVGGAGRGWHLALETATRERLAQCEEVRSGSVSSAQPGAANAVFRITDAKGEYFATLSQKEGNTGKYELATKDGKRLHFWGNFNTQAVNVTDEENGLMATTEFAELENEIGVYYRLRVAPLANVGHSLCALLCIGQILRASGGESHFRSGSRQDDAQMRQI